MCMKLSLGDLNPGPYLSHHTSTYTCGVTIASMVCGPMRWVLTSEECTNYQEYEYNAKATIEKLKGHLSQSPNCQENLFNSTQTKYKINHIGRVWKVYF